MSLPQRHLNESRRSWVRASVAPGHAEGQGHAAPGENVLAGFGYGSRTVGAPDFSRVRHASPARWKSLIKHLFS